MKILNQNNYKYCKASFTSGEGPRVQCARRLNGAGLRMRPQRCPSHIRCMWHVRRSKTAVSAEQRSNFCSPSPIMMTSSCESHLPKESLSMASWNYTEIHRFIKRSWKWEWYHNKRWTIEHQNNWGGIKIILRNNVLKRGQKTLETLHICYDDIFLKSSMTSSFFWIQFVNKIRKNQQNFLNR